VGEPVEVLTDQGRVTALLLSDDTGSDTPDYEVLCRERPLAKLVLDEVRSGDLLLALGAMHLKHIAGPSADDPCAALVTVEAETIARVLDAHG
jgi:hypothetical protein